MSPACESESLFDSLLIILNLYLNLCSTLNLIVDLSLANLTLSI